MNIQLFVFLFSVNTILTNEFNKYQYLFNINASTKVFLIEKIKNTIYFNGGKFNEGSYAIFIYFIFRHDL